MGIFLNIEERLNQIEIKIKEPSFLQNKGLGNEVGYFIFDYDPKYEQRVRKEIEYLKNKINNNPNLGFKILEFDLYEIILDILKNKGYLEKTFKFEETKGRDHAKKAVTKMLKLGMDSNLIVNYIIDRYTENSVIFITGVGKAYPLLRSHNVLNNLHQQLDEVPVIMFFPGRYSGNDLVLFNTIKDSNYYRAKQLIK